ncbi:MAG: GGDEF domain-containing protein [Hyphomicrobiales bacterium]|nr:GGDEF domain-containing protein [Hyphomicrobiales bacterium]MCP5370891.1 GGDEF domain-containing protein [Hyphomicrobiales bacterium]
MLYHLQRSENLVLQMLRDHVRDLAAVTANAVDGDLHKRVIAKATKESPEYRQAVAPLVDLHNLLPNVYYMYTMVAVDGRTFYVLDTTDQPGLKTANDLEPTGMLEEFEFDPSDRWVDVIYAGKVYVNENFETDDYGTFLSGHAPFYAGDGSIAGFSGVDFNVRDFIQRLAQFRRAYLTIYFFGIGLAVALGFFIYGFFKTIAAKAEAMEAASLTDPLTGASNRRAFEQRVRIDFKRFKRNGIASAVALIDADRFKSMNDSHGHDGGDEVLKALVSKVTEMLRESDSFARWGGEEFTILFADTDLDAAWAKADHVREALSRLAVPLPGGETVNFTVSIGVSAFEAADESPDAVLARADDALYLAKEGGRNQVQTKSTV